jgi:hypothetical protein
MERWRFCPECGSTNIHCDLEVTPRVADQRYANTIIYRKGLLGARRDATIDLFVCVDCENIRSFVSSDEVLRHIRDAWPRADSVMPGGDEEVRRLVERIEGGEDME